MTKNDDQIRELLGSGRYHVDVNGRLWKEVLGTNRKNLPQWRLCATVNSYGYLVTRWQYATLFVHRIAYAARVGPLAETMQINHVNGVKTDNRPANLELVSGKDNVAHAVQTGLRDPENTNTAKLTWDSVGSIRRLLNKGLTVLEASTQFGVSTSTIHSIRTRKTWKKGRAAPRSRARGKPTTPG